MNLFDVHQHLADLIAGLDSIGEQDQEDQISDIRCCIVSLAGKVENALHANDTGDSVRVLRLLEYTGTRRDVEEHLAKRGVKGERDTGVGTRKVYIREAFLGEYPETVGYLRPADLATASATKDASDV